ncbi:MAG: multiheme c-type cytochrome [Nannocystaceae bacterium]
MRTSFILAFSASTCVALACNGGDPASSATATAGTATTGQTSMSAGESSSTSSTTASESSGSAGESEGGTGEATGETTGETGDDRIDLPELEAVDDGHFATSPVCAECHSNEASATAMRDEEGREIGADNLWQGSMMANSARDPFWWAMVTAETTTFPAAKEAIEGECMRCHTPMAATDGAFHGEPAPTLDWLLAGDDRASLGLDGVACTACHQIQGANLGSPESFSGGYVIEPIAKIYGPHADPFTMPMMMHTSFTPTEGAQILDSGHCGSCHTLITDALTPQGAPSGHSLVEQGPYLEWRASAYSTEGVPGPDAASCQDCHVPKTSVGGVAISTRIARRPGGGDFPPVEPRSPFGRHTMVGGNVIMPLIIRDNADELRPRASAAALEASSAAARAQLEGATADVTAQATRDGDELLIDVGVVSMVGHKLPSGFPARRAWLAVTVRDKGDALVFRSGGYDDAGVIVDSGGTPLASEAVGGPIQPHLQEVTSDAQVQIYESVMGDADAEPAFRLLQGTAYLKDNRLLPKGWDPGHPDAPQVAPAGVDGDADFTGGGDVTRYRVAAPAAAGPYTVEVELCYQTLGSRFAAELFAIDAPQVRAFERMFKGAEREPVIVGAASTTAP